MVDLGEETRRCPGADFLEELGLLGVAGEVPRHGGELGF